MCFAWWPWPVSPPCAISANHSRSRHIGWVKSGHGLTSRPRETSNVKFLDELLFLFGYPPGSGVALLRGSLPLRYCTTRFAHKVPTWSLPAPGGVALLVGLDHGGMLVRSDPSSPDPGRIGNKSGVPGSGYKRVRLRRKKNQFMRFFGDLLGIILGHEFGRD